MQSFNLPPPKRNLLRNTLTFFLLPGNICGSRCVCDIDCEGTIVDSNCPVEVPEHCFGCFCPEGSRRLGDYCILPPPRDQCVTTAKPTTATMAAPTTTGLPTTTRLQTTAGQTTAAPTTTTRAPTITALPTTVAPTTTVEETTTARQTTTTRAPTTIPWTTPCKCHLILALNKQNCENNQVHLARLLSKLVQSSLWGYKLCNNRSFISS